MSAEGELALRRAAGDIARNVEQSQRNWRGSIDTNRSWVQGYLEGMNKAQQIIAWLADQEAGRQPAER